MGAASNAKGQDNDWLSQYLRSVRREVGTDTGKSVKDYARGAVVGLLGGLPDAIYSGMYPTADPLGATEALNKRWNATGSKSDTIGGLLGLPNPVSALAKAGLLSGAIKVWHGSPHKFDKFDFSKIGTGEGAQAYGHGGYFAEAKDVAGGYARGLSPNQIEGRAVKFDDPAEVAALEVHLQGGDMAKAADRLYRAAHNRTHAAPPDVARKASEILDGILDNKKIKKADRAASLPKIDQGNVYEANLRWPDAAREAADPLGPQHFMDWDKPLTQQPKHILDALGNDDYAKRILNQAIASNMSAGEYIKHISGRGPNSAEMSAQVSADLNAAGIPGIRYLDGGSRNAGQGTSNYVAFDDALAEILSRNGQPLGLLGR